MERSQPSALEMELQDRIGLIKQLDWNSQIWRVHQGGNRMGYFKGVTKEDGKDLVYVQYKTACYKVAIEECFPSEKSLCDFVLKKLTQ